MTSTRETTDNALEVLFDRIGGPPTIVEPLLLRDEDRNQALEKLDQYSHNAEDILIELAEKITAKLAPVRKERNRLIRVNQLPPELLVRIFYFYIFSSSKSSHFRRLNRLCLVCSSWDSLICSTPRLWALATITHKPKVICRAMRMSKQSPLTIDYATPSYLTEDNPAAADNVGHFMASARLHLARWRIAHINLRWAPNVLHRIDEPAPMLEVLDIDCTRVTSDMEPFNIFRGSAEMLREVSLKNIPIIWDAPFLSGLKTLRIENPQSKGLTLTALFPILARCPDLEELHLDNFHETLEELPTIVESVTLLRLRELTFHQPDHIGRFLLAHIEVGPQAELTMCYTTATDFSESSKTLASLLAPYIPKPSVTPEENIMLQVLGDCEVACWIPNRKFGGKNTSLIFKCREPLDVLDWICSSHILPVGQPVALDISHEDIPPHHFGYLDLSVAELLLRRVRGADRLLLHLSAPMKARDSICWPCPKLRTIWIEECGIQEDAVLTLVQNRYGHSRTLAKPYPEPMPIRLEKLSLYGEFISIQAMRELEELAGWQHIEYRPEGSASLSDAY